MAVALTPKSSSTSRMSKIHGSGVGHSTPVASSGGARSSRRKQRCWIFRVSGITRDVKESDLLSSVRERYTTVKRLVITPASNRAGFNRAPDSRSADVLVEVQFTGPQPSEGPGALLCDLLCGVSVDAQPVELPRGRKKRPRMDAASSEASDSDVEDALKKQAGNGGSGLQNVEEDDDEDSAGGGRCITAKPVMNGPGSSPVYAAENADDANTVRRLSRRNSGGAVAPSADLGTVPAVALFAGKSPLHDTRAVADTGGTQVMRAQQQIPVYQEGQQHQAQQQQQRHQAPPSTQQNQESQQQQQRESPPQAHQPHRGNGQQWDDVVLLVSTSPSPVSHALDMSSIDLVSPGQTVKTEFDPLLRSNSNASGAPWAGNNNEGGNPLLDATPTTQSGGHNVPRGWSFDTSGVNDDDFVGSNMVMDLGDVNDLFSSTEGDGEGGAGASTSTISGSNADAGAGARPTQDVSSNRWVPENVPQDKVIVEPSRKDCDFEGRPTNSPPAALNSRSSGNIMGAPNQCHLIITGLDRTGLDPRNLNVTVHFGVDSIHKMGKAAGPLQVGPAGRMYAPVFYPSMQEIWPALYSTANIRVVEVDVVVEIRSEGGDFQYVAPHLKVTYHRSPFFGDDSDRNQRGGRRSAHSGSALPSDETPNISYSCVDYSCGDWFAEMCQSVFRSGAQPHQPLHEDPHDLMSVDP